MEITHLFIKRRYLILIWRYFPSLQSLAEEEKKQFNDAAQGNLERVVMEKGLTNLEKEKAPRRPRASKKAFKDPNAPKKAMTSFLWFCDEMRPIVRNAHPTLTIGETAKILGHMWKDTDKSKYEAIAARDKERFTRVSILEKSLSIFLVLNIMIFYFFKGKQ